MTTRHGKKVALVPGSGSNDVIQVGERAAEKQLPYLRRLLAVEAAEVGG